MYVYLNGKIVPSKEALVSVFDHGFLYGDGVYETIRVYDRVIFMLDEHLQRLHRSASLIGLTIPAETDSLKIALYETLIANSLKNAYVRITVSRGPGSVGLDPDLSIRQTIVIIAQPLKEYPRAFYKDGISLTIAQTRRNLKEAIPPRIKSLNFLNNILAKIEAKKSGAHEAVMLNADGKLTEGTTSNLFFARNNIICTPSPACGILDGITRGIVIEIAKRKGFTIEEGEFTREDLLSAQEVFLTNTTMEVMPVSRVDSSHYPVGTLSGLLRTLYRQEVDAYISNVRAEGPSLWGRNG